LSNSTKQSNQINSAIKDSIEFKLMNQFKIPSKSLSSKVSQRYKKSNFSNTMNQLNKKTEQLKTVEKIKSAMFYDKISDKNAHLKGMNMDKLLNRKLSVQLEANQDFKLMGLARILNKDKLIGN